MTACNSHAQRPSAAWPDSAGSRRLRVALLIALVLAATTSGHAGEAEPKVPAGRDPGGVPVALIGPGVDYRAPEVFQRLARDGEGDLIGWDFIDHDLKPFAPDADCPIQSCGIAHDRRRADPVRLLLGEAAASRLIVLKTRDGDRGALAAAIAFAARSPARIVPTLAKGSNRGAEQDGGDPGPDWPVMIEAARRFSNLMFIVPAHGPPIGVPGFDTLAVGNLLIVAPVASSGTIAEQDAANPRPAADIAVAIEAPEGATATATLEQRAGQAVARIAALAARLLAVDPLLDAHGLKEKILSLAQPLPEPARSLARTGWLANPERHVQPN